MREGAQLGRFLIKRGCVLTLGAKTPNYAEADVLVSDGRIAEIGTGLRARDAETIDATDTIVMPGFVDTHRHAWKSLLRNVGGGSGRERTPSAAEYAAHHAPEDIYAATLLGLVSAAEVGITTVVDWFDAAPGDDFHQAALQAHVDAGLRTVFVHGSPAAGAMPDEPGLRRMAAEAATRPRTTIAFGSPDPHPQGVEALSQQWSLARELGLRIHVHARVGGVVEDLARAGLVAGDVTLVHCSVPSPADLDAITAGGAGVSLTPANEMAMGQGAPPLQELIDRGIRPGLGVDDETLAPGDLFAQMHTVQSLQHATMFERKLAGKAGLPGLLSTREVIRYATIDGARVAGLADVTGSLEVGKQADLILLRTDRPNIAPVNDPIGAVVWGMDPSNVDWVFVAGTPLMRAGVLQSDVAHVRSLALAASQRLSAAAGHLIGTGTGKPA